MVTQFQAKAGCAFESTVAPADRAPSRRRHPVYTRPARMPEVRSLILAFGVDDPGRVSATDNAVADHHASLVDRDRRGERPPQTGRGLAAVQNEVVQVGGY